MPVYLFPLSCLFSLNDYPCLPPSSPPTLTHTEYIQYIHPCRDSAAHDRKLPINFASVPVPSPSNTLGIPSRLNLLSSFSLNLLSTSLPPCLMSAYI